MYRHLTRNELENALSTALEQIRIKDSNYDKLDTKYNNLVSEHNTLKSDYKNLELKLDKIILDCIKKTTQTKSIRKRLSFYEKITIIKIT